MAEEEKDGAASLADAKEQLKQDIKNAYITAAAEGSEGKIFTISNLASNMRDAIHAFMTSAAVLTDVTTDTGQPDNVGGTSQTPGSGIGVGVLL